MSRHLRNNLIAYLALFVALGGTSYAAATGSIDSREIKNNTIRGKDIRTGAVKSSDVKNGSLLSGDFKAGELPAGPRGSTGAAGTVGARGATGSRGSTGSAAASFLGGTFEASGSGFLAPVGEGGSSAAFQTSDAQVAILSPARAIVARDLAVRENGRPAAETRKYTLAINGTNTLLSCIISDANGLSACKDTAHAVSIPPGSRISLHYERFGNGSGGCCPKVPFGWRATTP